VVHVSSIVSENNIGTKFLFSFSVINLQRTFFLFHPRNFDSSIAYLQTRPATDFQHFLLDICESCT